MNKLTLITGSLLAFLAVSVFTINSLTKEAKAQCCAPSTKQFASTDFFDIEALIADTEPKADNLFYSIVRQRFISVTKTQLSNANYINDIVPNYPSSWIDEYKEVAIIFVHNGKEEKITAPDNKITPTQHEMLKNLSVNDYIKIEVDYQMKNLVTNKLEASGMRVALGIIPATEAYFPDGYEELVTYLKENSQDKIKALKLKKTPEAQIEFTINEEGKAIDVKLVKPSENEKVDQLLLKLIESMPNWKPATDANGTPVTQKFEFRIGVDMC